MRRVARRSADLVNRFAVLLFVLQLFIPLLHVSKSTLYSPSHLKRTPCSVKRDCGCLQSLVSDRTGRMLLSTFRLHHWTWSVCILLCSTICDASTVQNPLSSSSKQRTTSANGTIPLDVFQVYKPPPPLPTRDHGSCSLLLMRHVFAYSYGTPFVTTYTPPLCPFNTVTINLTVTSSGRQFDRLALMYLGDIEIFRTSTAEPTATGIIWTYAKDMSAYLSLWKQPQTLIFDLGNLVDSTYTGSFNATLTAAFVTRPDPPLAADLILPISAQQSAQNGTSAFVLPTDNATTMQTILLGASRAIVSLSACGQATEEFWYSNVLSSDTDTFLNTTGELYGYSPFREVQLLIDGMLAGVIWPFPLIFTGGVAPGFWRPIVGIDVFDLREPEIDISPFLPYLSDGKPHAFQIKVVGLQCCDQNGAPELSDSVGSYWVVTGKIFLFAGATNTPADHLPPRRGTPSPYVTASSSIGHDKNGTNESLAYSVHVSRNIWIQSGGNYWYQTLDYTNNGLLTSQGLTQVNTQSTTGAFASYLPPSQMTQLTFKYPITVNTTYGVFPASSGIYIDARLSRGLEFFSTGQPYLSTFTLAAGPSALETEQHGSAYYSSQTNKSFSAGDTVQDFWQGSDRSQYARNVEAVNGSVVRDSNGASRSLEVEDASTLKRPRRQNLDIDVNDIRSFLGRGPGRPRGLFS